LQNSIHAAGAAALLVAVVAANNPAHAQQICGQFDSTTVMNKYVVQNNRWNNDVSNNNQCINVHAKAPGFKITKETGNAPYTGPNAGGPLGYPNIYIGCRYTDCSPESNLPYTNCSLTPKSTLPSGDSTTKTVSPWQLRSIKRAKSCIVYDLNVDDAIFDASYDIWLDSTKRTDGVSQVEIMIWLTHSSGVNPIGTKVAATTISKFQWDVYAGNNGANDVISYVAMLPIDSITFDVLEFVEDAKNREAKNPNPVVKGPFEITGHWYLTSIQAGFEPWQCSACNDQVGLAVKKFEAIVE
jgi:Glycosyl hydrolase family 12